MSTVLLNKAVKAKKTSVWNRRKTTLLLCIGSFFFLGLIAIGGYFLSDSAMVTDFTRKNLQPCFEYPFGTDWMGRDMFARTINGLSLSIFIGILAAFISALAALVLGTLAATLGKWVDGAITWFIDLVMGIPHILLLILISFAAGKGLQGVIIGVALTHWTSLARVIRSEVLQLKESQYIQIAGRLGQSKLKIAVKHMIPHLIPQFLVGLILLFPHAILHESSITFLGFGLSPEQPAIGIILSESMKYLTTGMWWLALFPGIMLVFTVALFDIAGGALKKLIDPNSAHQ